MNVVYVFLIFIAIGIIIYYFRRVNINPLRLLSIHPTTVDKITEKIVTVKDNIIQMLPTMPTMPTIPIISKVKSIVSGTVSESKSKKIVKNDKNDSIKEDPDLPWDADIEYCKRREKPLEVSDLYKKTYNYEPEVVMY